MSDKVGNTKLACAEVHVLPSARSSMTRRLRSNFKVHAKQQLAKLGVKGLAHRIGIAETTLRKLLGDDWEYFNRDVIERICDYFSISLDQIFALEPDNFWVPFQRTNRCTFVRGSPSNPRKKGVQVRAHDLDATSRVQRFLQASLPDIVSTSRDLSSQDSADPDVALSENCIVIGSPRSNPATEVLLTGFFHAAPLDTTEGNRSRLPVAFSWPTDWAIPSALSVSKHPPGVYLRALDRIIAAANYWPREEFHAKSTSKGLDCGIVFVANKAFPNAQDVKLIILSGFSGIGTIGAADAVVNDFRDLEPLPEETHVLGVVQAYFTKSSGRGDTREYKKYDWRYRAGGRNPIQALPKKNKGQQRS